MERKNPVGSLRRRQFEAAVRSLQTGSASAHSPARDPELLGLVETPFDDVVTAEERLHALQRAFEARDDRRAIFLSIYSRMTSAVARHIDRGTFSDPDWVSTYLVTFANHYREAVYAYELGDDDVLPTPWRLAFEATERENSLVIQDAVLGVNAHINYDLALALATVGTRNGDELRRTDHDAVIDVIKRLVDETQDSLAAQDAAGLSALDAALGSLDESLTVFTIDECRDSAWRTAIALESHSRIRRQFARWFNAATATGAARIILSSHTSARVHETLADLERSASDE